MNVLDLIATLTLDTSGWDSKLSSASHSAAQMSGDVQHRFDGVAYAAESLGDGLAIVGSGIIGTAGLGVKAASTFESAFTGVTKTVNTDMYETQEEIDTFFGGLKEGLLDLSERTPMTVEGLAAIAEAAGQLGVSNDFLMEYTEIIAGLTSATNLSAEEAAFAFARYANVAGLPEENIKNLASSVVHLGNNSAATESEIAKFLVELANLGRTTNLTDADIAALSTTLASSGARAESSRTAMMKFTYTINGAVANGGAKLQLLADTAGMTAEEFSKAWKEDAMSAMIAFFNGLSGKESVEAQETMEELFGKNVRMNDIILRLSNNVEGLEKNVAYSNKAWEENTALSDEVAKRNETLESKWTMLKNTVKELAINVGDALLPRIKEMLPHIQEWVDKAAEYVKENPNVIENITKVGAALLGLGTAISTITKVAVAIASISTAIKLLTGGGAVAGAAGAAGAAGTAAAGGGLIGGLGAALSALGPIILGIGAVVGIFAVGWHNDWFGCQETFNRVYEETGSKAEAFKAVIRSIADQIVEKVKELGQNILGWWNNTAVPWFENVGKNIAEFLINLYASVDEWFSNVWSSISEWFSNLLNSVAEWLVNLYSNAEEWFTNTWNSILDWFDNLLNSVGEWLFNMYANIDTWFTNLITSVSDWLANIWNNITETLVSIWNTVTEKITEIWNWIVEKFTELINTIGEKLREIWNTIVEKLTQIREEVYNKVTETWEKAKNTLQEAKNSVHEIFNAIREAISAKMEQIKSSVSSAVESIKAKIRSIIDAIGDAWQKVKDFASNAWNTLTGSFGGGRASGGYISAGNTYLVGENGPELITASKNSYVHNAQETADIFGGNRNIIININGDIYDDQNSMKRKLRGAVLDVIREQVAYG